MHGRSKVLQANAARCRGASARRGRAIAIALASAGLLIASGTAEAAKMPPKSKKARFSVTVKGKQVTAWVTNYQGTGRCDASVSGSGAESWTFETPKDRVTVIDTGLGVSPFVIHDDPLDGLLAVGKVTRSGSLTVTPVTPDSCADGGCGPDCPPPPAPDCGTKHHFAHPMHLDYFGPAPAGMKAKDLLVLKSMFRDPSGDIFKNCPRGAGSYPALIESDTAGKPIGAKLPSKQLFDRALGKIIVKATGKRFWESRGHSVTTTLSWEATFRRRR